MICISSGYTFLTNTFNSTKSALIITVVNVIRRLRYEHHWPTLPQCRGETTDRSETGGGESV